MDGSTFSSPITYRRDTILNIPSEGDTSARLAVTIKELKEAYKIRHDGYLSYGYIAPQEGGLFSDSYDQARNERTVVIYRADIPAATIRICLHDHSGTWPDASRIPAMEIFREEILALEAAAIQEGNPGRVIEITRFARDPAFANDRSLIIAAFRIVAYLRLYFEADIMINAVRPHHMPMYRRLGFKKVAEPRQYPNLTYCACLMAMLPDNYDAALQKIGFPYGISISDPIYSRLVAGDLVTVFASDPDMHMPPISHTQRAQMAY